MPLAIFPVLEFKSHLQPPATPAKVRHPVPPLRPQVFHHVLQLLDLHVLVEYEWFGCKFLWYWRYWIPIASLTPKKPCQSMSKYMNVCTFTSSRAYLHENNLEHCLIIVNVSEKNIIQTSRKPRKTHQSPRFSYCKHTNRTCKPPAQLGTQGLPQSSPCRNSGSWSWSASWIQQINRWCGDEPLSYRMWASPW